MKYLIVDIDDGLVELQELEQFKIIFDKFPLKDIITIILSVEQEKDYSDILFFEMEKRLGELIDVIDLDMFQIFIEYLAKTVDESIDSKSPTNLNPSDYIFENWVSNNIVILKKVK